MFRYFGLRVARPVVSTARRSLATAIPTPTASFWRKNKAFDVKKLKSTTPADSKFGADDPRVLALYDPDSLTSSDASDALKQISEVVAQTKMKLEVSAPLETVLIHEQMKSEVLIYEGVCYEIICCCAAAELVVCCVLVWCFAR